MNDSQEPTAADEALLGGTFESLTLLALVSFLEQGDDMEIAEEEVTRKDFRMSNATTSFASSRLTTVHR